MTNLTISYKEEGGWGVENLEKDSYVIYKRPLKG